MRIADFLIGFGVITFLVTGPWAFGTTQPWAILSLNVLGIILGLVTGFRYMVSRYNAKISNPAKFQETAKTHFSDLALALLTLSILAYILISALNKRATYDPTSWHYLYHNAIDWLPHSYDSQSTWKIFWVYLGLAGYFWACRSWVMNPMPQKNLYSRLPAQPGSGLPGEILSRRIRVLLWILCINAALVGLAGLLQRIDGTNKLLWLVEPDINKDSISQFGPYAYRANAAQYFNLVWPVALGLWLTYFRQRHFCQRTHYNILLPILIILILCPIFSNSRGGALVTAGSLLFFFVILSYSRWGGTWRGKSGLFLVLGAALLIGMLFSWEHLAPRFSRIEEGFQSREVLLITGRKMLDHNMVFGTGPGSFANLYQFYMRLRLDPRWAQLHNDWYQTLITFGAVGSILILSALLLVLVRCFGSRGIPTDREFVGAMWLALGGCLFHAIYDLPFQVHSVLSLFIFLCAILSCVSCRRRI